jgi:hypothetical protein
LNKVTLAGVGLVLGALVLGGSAIALGGSSNDPQRAGTRAAGGAQALAVGGAQAPNARIAAFVSAGGAVVRSKGIKAVTHPSTGLYCVDPKDSTFKVNKAIPSVSVDWSTSSGDALMAQWRSSAIGCSSGWFAVLTFDGEDGTFDFSDAVSFTIVVP